MLVLLNGIPGSGKSTIARVWAQRRPSALVIDIDVVRAALPDWRDDLTVSGLLARAICLAVAREQLRVGGEVIIPQYLGRPEFLDQLDALVRQEQARLIEVAIVDPLDETFARFARRPTDDSIAAHAAAEVANAGGREELARTAQRLATVLEQRPSMSMINTGSDGIDAAADALEQLTGRPPAGPTGPRLVVVAGLPGTGKTTLARGLVAELGGVVLRVDAIENELARHDHVVGPLGYAICHLLAATSLGLGATVVVDAVNPVPEARQSWRQLADEHAAPITVLETMLPDEAEHRRRVEDRQPDLADQRMPTWSEVLSGGYRAWDATRDGPRLVIDTTDRAAALAATLTMIS